MDIRSTAARRVPTIMPTTGRLDVEGGFVGSVAERTEMLHSCGYRSLVVLSYCILMQVGVLILVFTTWLCLQPPSFKGRGFACDSSGLLSHLTLAVLVTTIDAQWEGMGDVGSVRYEPALLPPCPTIRVF